MKTYFLVVSLLYSSWLGMVMRMCLAALDWNSNVNSAQKLSQVGQPVYRVKVDRSGKRSMAPLLVKKSYQWQTDLFNRMVEGLGTDQIPQHQVLNSPSLCC